MAVVDARTVIRRYIYSSDINDIHDGDSLNIVGTMGHSGKILAERIQISLPRSEDRGYYPIGKDYKRLDEQRPASADVIEGTVEYPASRFDRTLGINTKYGDRKINVRKDAEVFIDKRSASVHDLMKGDYIRATGRWDASTLIASRVETISDTHDEAHREPPSKPDDTPPVAATPNAEDKQLPNHFEGRIVEIDYTKHEIVVDSEMRDFKVDAIDTPITKKGSSRRFSELKVGDKVSVKGEWTDSILKASTIEIAE